MANIIIAPDLSVEERLRIMNESAKDDIADGEAEADAGAPEDFGIEGIRAPKPPPKVPKVFVSNHCIFNCSYCCMRTSNDEKRRYVHEPREVANASVEAGKNNGYGVFISSAIYRSPDHTEERIIETLRIMRQELHYTGYIHAKVMPGTDPKLIEQAGWLADRLSVNIELPKSEGYSTIAKQKNKINILTPMTAISDLVAGHRHEIGTAGRRFARSGQTTQIMVGAMKESDRTQVCLAEAMYRKFNLRRVYYSPFGPVQDCECLPSDPTPMWRTRRLYQADRLLQLYHFKADDVTPEDSPDLFRDIDPKAAWALRNLDMYPLEINKADYEELIRIPGIGITSARKIMEARKYRTLTTDHLIKMGVPLKRSKYFITCGGKYQCGNLLDSPSLRELISDLNGDVTGQAR